LASPPTTDLEVPGARGVTHTTPAVRLVARKLVEDETYQKLLLERMKDGTAGPMEPLLWKYAYGDPRIHHPKPVDAQDKERFDEIRRRARDLLKDNPARAKEIDMAFAVAAQEPIDVEAEVSVEDPDA
jgi:hypothetical protein